MVRWGDSKALVRVITRELSVPKYSKVGVLVPAWIYLKGAAGAGVVRMPPGSILPLARGWSGMAWKPSRGGSVQNSVVKGIPAGD